METMQLWNTVCETNPDSTKQVNDGRRRFTAIDAYAQIRKATELWGPYGGKWRLNDMNLHAGPTGQLCYLTAVFEYPHGSFPVMNAIKHTSNKGIVDADCLKKLETDTLTKALSKLGFNADVFLGLFDDNRCVQEQRQKHKDAPQPSEAHDDFKAKAEALMAKHTDKLAQSPDVAAWCAAAHEDGFYQDIFNTLKQNWGE